MRCKHDAGKCRIKSRPGKAPIAVFAGLERRRSPLRHSSAAHKASGKTASGAADLPVSFCFAPASSVDGRNALHTKHRVRLRLKPFDRHRFPALPAQTVGALGDGCKRIAHAQERSLLTSFQSDGHLLGLNCLHAREPANRRIQGHGRGGFRMPLHGGTQFTLHCFELFPEFVECCPVHRNPLFSASVVESLVQPGQQGG
jgi:hypothetical protein